MALAGFACGGEDAAPARLFVVTYQAQGAPGEPLDGVEVSVDGEPVGSTDEYGLLQSFLRGSAGQSRLIEHRCPEGWAAPEGSTPRTVQLSRDQALDPSEARLGLQVKMRCLPQEVRVAVVVDTDEPGIESAVNGEVVGRTDEEGLLFHVARATPGTQLALAFHAPGTARRTERLCAVGVRDSLCAFHVRLPAPVEEPRPVRPRPRRRTTMRATMSAAPPVMREVTIPEAF
ncbi:MAG: hypothetical protein AAF447_12625 [Myxococcota bacterium]